jgi:hypothetical protein
MRNSILFLLVILLSGCFARRHKEYVSVRDTVIIPPIVKLDTLVQWNDRFIQVADTTGQMTVTIERVKNNYIRVKGKCKPEKIIVPVTKTVTKTKDVIVENRAYKYLSLLLLLFIVAILVRNKFSTLFR